MWQYPAVYWSPIPRSLGYGYWTLSSHSYGYWNILISQNILHNQISHGPVTACSTITNWLTHYHEFTRALTEEIKNHCSCYWKKRATLSVDPSPFVPLCGHGWTWGGRRLFLCVWWTFFYWTKIPKEKGPCRESIGPWNCTHAKCGGVKLRAKKGREVSLSIPHPYVVYYQHLKGADEGGIPCQKWIWTELAKHSLSPLPWKKSYSTNQSHLVPGLHCRHFSLWPLNIFN